MINENSFSSTDYILQEDKDYLMKIYTNKAGSYFQYTQALFVFPSRKKVRIYSPLM